MKLVEFPWSVNFCWRKNNVIYLNCASTKKFHRETEALALWFQSARRSKRNENKDLVESIGYGQRSIEEWIELIEKHHHLVRASSAHEMQASIEEMFEYFPT